MKKQDNLQKEKAQAMAIDQDDDNPWGEDGIGRVGAKGMEFYDFGHMEEDALLSSDRDPIGDADGQAGITDIEQKILSEKQLIINQLKLEYNILNQKEEERLKRQTKPQPATPTKKHHPKTPAEILLLSQKNAQILHNDLLRQTPPPQPPNPTSLHQNYQTNSKPNPQDSPSTPSQPLPPPHPNPSPNPSPYPTLTDPSLKLLQEVGLDHNLLSDDQ